MTHARMNLNDPHMRHQLGRWGRKIDASEPIEPDPEVIRILELRTMQRIHAEQAEDTRICKDIGIQWP